MTRKFINLNTKSLHVLILVATLPTMLSILPQEASASSNAFDQGYENGRSDYLNGYSKDSYCDPNNAASNPDAFCAAYKAGYEAGWLAASLLYGNQ